MEGPGNLSMSHSTAAFPLLYCPGETLVHWFHVHLYLRFFRYTDVMHEVKPIQSGYRLALSFNLIQKKSLPIESHLQAIGAAQQYSYHHILSSWKETADVTTVVSGKAPNKLAILLDHQYTAAEFSANAFKGSDQANLGHLLAVAKTLDFEVYFASVDFHVQGQPEDEGPPRGYYRRRGRGWYDDEESEPEDAEMGEVVERTLDIGDLKNVDGSFAFSYEDLQIDEGTEMIPQHGLASLEEDEPDKKEYEGYMGKWTIVRTVFPMLSKANAKFPRYKRMIMVLWPKSRSFDVLLDLDPAEVDEELESFAEDADQDSQEDRAKLEWFLQVYQDERVDAEAWAAIFLDMALRWKDVNVWNRAFCGPGGDHILDAVKEEIFLEAVETFTFAAIQSRQVIVNSPIICPIIHPIFTALRSCCSGQQARLEYGWLFSPEFPTPSTP
jgi:hypothetical protein